MTGVVVRLLRLPHGEGLPLPTYHSEHAAGLDVVAGVPENAPVGLAPGARALIPTGFALELPPGFEAQLRPRSGLALKSGVTILNSPGTIDADYRGEVKVLLVNLGAGAVRCPPRDAHRPARGRPRRACAHRACHRARRHVARGRAASALRVNPPSASCPDLIRASMPYPFSEPKRQWNGLPGQARQ